VDPLKKNDGQNEKNINGRDNNIRMIHSKRALAAAVSLPIYVQGASASNPGAGMG
jgi:hypothetical protein